MLVNGKTNQRFASLQIIWDEVWCREVNLASNNIFIHLHNLFYFILCGPTSSDFLKGFLHIWIFLHTWFYAFVYFLNHLLAFVTSSVHFYGYFSPPSGWLYSNRYLFCKELVLWYWLSQFFIFLLHSLFGLFWWGEGLSILSVTSGWDFHSFHSELLYLLLTMRPF